MIISPLSCAPNDVSLKALVLRGVLCSLLAVLLSLSPVNASEPLLELFCEDDTLTLSAMDVPVVLVLQEISHQCGLSVRGIENARGVFTGRMRRVSISDLLRRILTENDYTLVEVPDGEKAAASLTISLPSGKDGGSSEDALSLLQQSDALPSDQKKAVLFQAARDRNPFVRELAYRKLYGSYESELAEILKKDSSDPDPDVRRVSVSALGELFGSPALGILREATADPNPDVRIAAFQGLSQLPQNEGLETLRKLLRSPDPEIRLLAIETMAALGEREAREAALIAIRDRDELVRGRAGNILTETVTE